MPGSHTGHCRCGRTGFRLAGQPGRVLVCHYSDCRKLSGGGPSWLVVADAGQFAATGAPPAVLESTADSGNSLARAFCAGCGTPLWARSSGYPDLVLIHRGAFDEDPGPLEAKAIWTDGAPDWLPPPTA